MSEGEGRRKAPIAVAIAAAMMMPVLVGGAELRVDAGRVGAIVDGRCSLVEAIDNANADDVVHADCPAGDGADAIELLPSLRIAGEVLFNLVGPNALPPITSEIVIHGRRRTIQRAPSAPPFRFFHVTAGGDLTLEGITLAGGFIDSGFDNGGTVYVAGDLTLLDVTVRDSLVGSIFPSGGGVFGTTDSSMTLIGSRIIGNVADNGEVDQVFDNGGGIYTTGALTLRGSEVRDNFAGEQGGGIHASGTSLIDASTVSGNMVALDGGGGALLTGTQTHQVVNSTISGNRAQTRGGGLSIVADTTLTGVRVSDNEAAEELGGGLHVAVSDLTIRGARFEGNRALGPAVGGAVGAVSLASTLIQGSSFIGNSAEARGGALFTQLAPLIIEDSLIADNEAPQGGGLYQGPSNVDGFYLVRTAVVGNRAETFGGGYYGEGNLSLATAINSTFSRNSATTFGGGIMLNQGGLIELVNVTVADNASDQFGNSVGGVNAFAGTMTIDNTIVADNLQEDCSATSGSSSLDDTLTTGPAGGIPPDRWCSFIPLQANDRTDTDPLLGEIGANGNLGPSHALGAGSPAIGLLADDCPATLDGVDQRGVPRPAGSCDTGALSAANVDLPSVAFATPSTLVDEDPLGGVVLVDIVLDHPASGLAAPGSVPLTVLVRIDGSAVRDRDYALGLPYPVAFVFEGLSWPPPGTVQTLSLPVTLLDDDRLEGTETIEFELLAWGPGSVVADASLHTLTINDDEVFEFSDSFEDL